MIFKLLSLLFSKIMLLFGRIKENKAFEKPLSSEEEKQLFEQYKLGDKEAEEKLVKHNMRLVAHVALKYKQNMAQDELIAIGSIGLLKAIKNFNTNKNNSFSTYATRCIDNEILMYIRANKKHNCQVYLEDAIMADKDGNEMSLLEVIPDKFEDLDEKISNKIAFEQIEKIIDQKLTERERKVIYMRYGICGYSEYTQMEISNMLGISRSYISRIEKHALEIIKKYAKDDLYK